MTTAVIVQARIGSSRLPGKVLMDLCGEPVITRVLDRCRQIPGVDILVCAVPDTRENDELADVAARDSDIVVRGPEDDVLARYVMAAQCVQANVIVRITADCPLINPKVCASVIALRDRSRAAYASNVHPRSFPHGLDCEVFTRDALMRASRGAHTPYDREHVTPYMLRDESCVNLFNATDESYLRLVLDTAVDLANLRAVYERLSWAAA